MGGGGGGVHGASTPKLGSLSRQRVMPNVSYAVPRLPLCPVPSAHTWWCAALYPVSSLQDKGSVLISGGVDAQLLAYRARAFLQVGGAPVWPCDGVYRI